MELVLGEKVLLVFWSGAADLKYCLEMLVLISDIAGKFWSWKKNLRWLATIWNHWRSVSKRYKLNTLPVYLSWCAWWCMQASKHAHIWLHQNRHWPFLFLFFGYLICPYGKQQICCFVHSKMGKYLCKTIGNLERLGCCRCRIFH